MKLWKKGAVGATALTASTWVLAAVPESVTDALTAAKTDATTVAAAVIGIIVAIAAFGYMRRAIR